MGMLEIFATIFTVACVLLANVRSTWQYPIGIIGTTLFFFLFWQIGLYSSAVLQILFCAVQIYGWWFWLKGDNGNKPKIKAFDFYKWGAGALIGTLFLGAGIGHLVGTFSGAAMPTMDAQILSFSLLAQFMLDRKIKENWLVWAIVNAVSVYVYASQGLMITTVLYAGLFINAFVGYFLWNKEYKGYA
jgi:nicotinamide mononucleotide transporter